MKERHRRRAAKHAEAILVDTLACVGLRSGDRPGRLWGLLCGRRHGQRRAMSSGVGARHDHRSERLRPHLQEVTRPSTQAPAVLHLRPVHVVGAGIGR
jgi:hypothetical protein